MAFSRLSIFSSKVGSCEFNDWLFYTNICSLTSKFNELLSAVHLAYYL